MMKKYLLLLFQVVFTKNNKIKLSKNDEVIIDLFYSSLFFLRYPKIFSSRSWDISLQDENNLIISDILNIPNSSSA